MDPRQSAAALLGAAGLAATPALLDKAVEFSRSMLKFAFLTDPLRLPMAVELACRVLAIGFERKQLLAACSNVQPDEYRRQLSLCKSSLNVSWDPPNVHGSLLVLLPHPVFDQAKQLVVAFSALFSTLSEPRRRTMALQPDIPLLWCAATTVAVEDQKASVQREALCELADVPKDVLRRAAAELRTLLANPAHPVHSTAPEPVSAPRKSRAAESRPTLPLSTTATEIDMARVPTLLAPIVLATPSPPCVDPRRAAYEAWLDLQQLSAQSSPAPTAASPLTPPC